MRAALNYLVYELAQPEVRKKGRTQFPIFTNEQDFQSNATSMIEGITGDDRELIERVQPYNATKVPANDPLAILNKLSNRDKHRLLIPMIAAVNRTGVWAAADNADVRFHFLHDGPVEHGDEIVRFSATPKDPAKKDEGASRVELRNTDHRDWFCDADVGVRPARNDPPPHRPHRHRALVRLRSDAADVARISRIVHVAPRRRRR
jgi:hypothetical protein